MTVLLYWLGNLGKYLCNKTIDCCEYIRTGNFQPVLWQNLKTMVQYSQKFKSKTTNTCTISMCKHSENPVLWFFVMDHVCHSSNVSWFLAELWVLEVRYCDLCIVIYRCPGICLHHGKLFKIHEWMNKCVDKWTKVLNKQQLLGFSLSVFPHTLFLAIGIICYMYMFLGPLLT